MAFAPPLPESTRNTSGAATSKVPDREITSSKARAPPAAGVGETAASGRAVSRAAPLAHIFARFATAAPLATGLVLWAGGAAPEDRSGLGRLLLPHPALPSARFFCVFGRTGVVRGSQNKIRPSGTGDPGCLLETAEARAEGGGCGRRREPAAAPRPCTGRWCFAGAFGGPKILIFTLFLPSLFGTGPY